MREMFQPLPAVLLLAALTALPGCAQRSCANYSVLDYLDSIDRDSDLAHVGLVRSSVATRIGPDGNAAQCSVWEKVHLPGRPGVGYRPQYYSVRLHNNGWLLEREPFPAATVATPGLAPGVPFTASRRPSAS